MKRLATPLLFLCTAACTATDGGAREELHWKATRVTAPAHRADPQQAEPEAQETQQDGDEELVIWNPNRPGEVRTVKGNAADLEKILEGGALQAEGQPVEAAVVQEALGKETVAEPRRGLSENELSIWNEPIFQRAFAESYLAESDVEPRMTAIEIERMLEIRDLISADKLDRAKKILEEERGGASSAVFDFTLGNLYFQEEELEHAAGIYRTAIQKYPKFRRAYRNLGLVHARLEQYDQAAPALSRVIELGGGDAVTYGLLGISYSNIGQDISAESAFRMAMLLDQETIEWKKGLVRSFFKQKRYADVVALCDNLIAKDPESSELWLIQANAFLGLEQTARAAENFELVGRLGKATPASLNMLGDIYVNESLFDLAVDSYVRAMQAKPDASLDRPLRAAKVLVSQGAHDETLRLIGEIENLGGAEGGQFATKPEVQKELLKLRARIAVAQDAGGEEARILREIVELDPLDGEALILLGHYYAGNEEVEQAVFHYERAANIEEFEAEAKLRHAQLLVRQSRYAEALPLLRRALDLEPSERVREYMEQIERLSKNR